MRTRHHGDLSPAVGKLLRAMMTPRALPKGATVIAELRRHPMHGWGCLAVRLGSGIEMAWDGVSFRSLPRNWRDLVDWTPVEE